MINKSIGWIGTGLMGKPMAGHIQKSGYALNIYNRTRSKADDLLQLGARWCNDPAEITQKSDIVFTIIGYPADVEKVYFGKDGILSSIREGQIVVDMTTTSPSLAERIAKAAESKGAWAVDAPVSGGVVGAINATLSIMIGGKREMVEQVMPIFNVLGKNSVYQGKAGAGQHTKMCNQIAIAGTMIGVCESLIYATKAGLDLNTVLQSISKGAAGCWTLDVLAPKIVNSDFAPGFMVEHFVKDLGIALDEAARMQLCLPGLALVRQLYTSLQAEGNGREGTQALFNVLKKLAAL